MMKNILLACLLIFVSCKSYQITPSSLKSQLEQTDVVENTFDESLEGLSYHGENLLEIKVLDAKKNEVVLDTESPIVLKVTRKDGFEFKYYLNSISLNNTTFSGMGPTYLVGGAIHRVHIDSISSIKIKP